jgi:protein tyrosine phosphatase (PTP) superfamily phosphohydrolase (DUF442 family)
MVSSEAVSDWILAVKALGVRSVICLLSKPELRWYEHLKGGLLGAYHAAGLETMSLPVPLDAPGVLTRKHLEQLEAAFARLPRPMVIHCSAGMVRSGAAVAYLVEHSLATTLAKPPTDPEILRRIRNSKREYTSCAMRSGAYGLEDYGVLYHLLETVSESALSSYLDEIDVVRQTHEACLACSLKFLAFCTLFSQGRLPERHFKYTSEYSERLQRHRGQRDFMDEVIRVIARSGSPLPSMT